MDHRAAQILALGNPDTTVIEHRARTTAGGEQFIAKRIEDHRVDRLTVLDQGDGHAVMREAAQVVAGAVQRIDDPHVTVDRLHATFLTHDPVFGIGALEFLDDDLFRICIDFTGIVHAALLHDVQRLELVDVAQQDVAGEAGGLDHDGDGGFLHGEKLP